VDLVDEDGWMFAVAHQLREDSPCSPLLGLPR
jgi:hypothetical protein